MNEVVLRALDPEKCEPLMTEKRKKDAKVLLDSGEVEFGHADHVADIKKTLAGLERLRDCYETGSGARMTFGLSCTRLRKLLSTLENHKSHPAAVSTLAASSEQSP